MEVGTVFFGVPAADAYICLDGAKCNDGNKDTATKRIKITLSAGRYGDAYTDATLSAYTISTPAPATSATSHASALTLSASIPNAAPPASTSPLSFSRIRL